METGIRRPSTEPSLVEENRQGINLTLHDNMLKNENIQLDPNILHKKDPIISKNIKKIPPRRKRKPSARKFKSYYPMRKRRFVEPSVLMTDPEMTELHIPAFLQHAYLTGMPNPQITQLREWQVELFKHPFWYFKNADENTIDSHPELSINSLDSQISSPEVASFFDGSFQTIHANLPINHPPKPGYIIKPSNDMNNSNLGCSGIIVVPTSGGKTVAADVSIAQLLENDPTAKVIYALPFVALANEKFNEFSERFYRFSVRAFYQNVGGPDFRRGHIAVCTYEKAHSIINSALLGKYENKIKLVVIDEIHMIGEDHRGAVIEALVLKLLLMKHTPRIIGLTATINLADAELLANWIHGFYFSSDIRPSQVKQFIAKPNGELHLITKNGRIQHKKQLLKVENRLPPSSDANVKNSYGTTDMFYVVDPIRRLLAKSPEATILIFVNTRADTVRLAEFISRRLYDPSLQLPRLQPLNQEQKDNRRALIQDLARVSGFVDEAMKKCIINGIGIHHAGLLLEERKLIEAAAKNKAISVIVATTTLSAGVNIHSVARVFIMNIYRWSPGQGQVAIPNAQYTQMVGRAGRSADINGKAIVFAHTQNENEIRKIVELSKHQIADIVPHLKEEGELERFFLQCLSTRLVDPVDGLDTFFNATLSQPKKSRTDNSALESPNTISDEELIERNKARDRLIQKHLIDPTTFIPTPLGRAIAGSSLSIDEGLTLYQTIEHMEMDLCLKDEIHLLYLCVSHSIANLVRPEPYNNPRWIYILQKHKHVIHLITGMTDQQIINMQDRPDIYGGLGRVDPKIDTDMDRIYVSVILDELINETPIADIMRKFKIDRGTIQSLQMQAATFAGQTSKFCEIIGSGLLATTLNRFRQRLNFAARTELLGLMILPSMTKNIARKLVNVGITSPIELAELTADGIAALIVNADGNEAMEDDRVAPTPKEIELAGIILKDSKNYTESFTKLEILEEAAVANMKE